MKKLISFVSLMIVLVVLAGCNAVSAPSVKANPPDNSEISSNLPALKAGSGENVVRYIDPLSLNSVYFGNGSGENVARPIDPLPAASNSIYIGSGSGENVSRPTTANNTFLNPVSTSGENVVPPPGTMAYQALHPSTK